MGFAEEMAQHDAQWTDDQAKSGLMPDGKQQAQITMCRVEEGDRGYQWVIGYQNAEGFVRNWYGLDNETGREFAARDAKKLGFTGLLSELEAWCEEEKALNLMVQVTVVTKPGTNRDYTNAYLDRVLGMGEPNTYPSGAVDPTGAEEPDFAPTTADDDIPF